MIYYPGICIRIQVLIQLFETASFLFGFHGSMGDETSKRSPLILSIRGGGVMIKVTDKAADELKKMITAEDKSDMVVRLYLAGMG